MMKKTLSWILALVIIMSTFSCIGVSASAAADGIKYFTIDFSVNGNLLNADQKPSIDFASEDSYKTQCEAYLYGDGNILTMYTTDGKKVVYEGKTDNSDFYYLETAGEDADILEKIKDFLGLRDGRKITTEDIFVDSVSVTGAKNDFFTVKLSSGLSTDVYVDLVNYPVDSPVSFTFKPAKKWEVYEGCCGYVEELDDGKTVFRYSDFPAFGDDDELVLNFFGKKSVGYTYYDGAFRENETGNELTGMLYVDILKAWESQENEPWELNKTYEVVLAYDDEKGVCESTVSVKVVKSPVKAIEYVQVTPIEIYEESNGEFDEGVFIYDTFDILDIKDNKFVVTYTDDKVDTFISDGKGKFINANGVALDTTHMVLSTDQYNSPWTIDGSNEIEVECFGAKTTVNVTIVQNPIESISYTSSNIPVVKEGVDGEWFVNNDDDNVFVYDCKKAVLSQGSQIVINYKNGSSSVYTCDASGNYVNGVGEKLNSSAISVTAYSQDDRNWLVNKVYSVQLTYQGATCDVDVKTVPQSKPATPIAKAYNVENGIKVYWDETYGAESYNVYRIAQGEKKWTLLKNVKTTSYTDTTVENGVYYRYTIRAKNHNGLSPYDATGVLRLHVATPVITKINNAKTGVYTEWTKVNGVSNYRVYRRYYKEGRARTAGWKYLGTTKNNYYCDKTIVNANGEVFEYVVRAVYSGKIDTYSDFRTGITIKRLAAPLLKSATAATDGVLVKWTLIAGSDGYKVYRRPLDSSESDWSLVKDVTGVKNTSCIDVSAELDGAYIYTVRAYSGSEKSAYNAGVVYAIPTAPAVKTVKNTTNGVEVSWGKADRADSYNVYRRGESGTWELVASNVKGTSYTDTTAQNGKYQRYTVEAVNDAGSNGNLTSNAGKYTKYVATPALKSTYYNSSKKTVTLKWSQVNGATEYQIYRRTAKGKWQLIDIAEGGTYVDENVKANSYYVYTVRAVNGGWRSSYESGIGVNTVKTTNKF